MSELEELLRQAHKTDEQRAQLNAKLATAELYCLGHMEDDDGSDTHADIAIEHWEDDSGNQFVPVFSSLETLGQLADEGQEYLCISGATLFAICSEDTIIIDLESEHEYSLDPSAINAILTKQ